MNARPIMTGRQEASRVAIGRFRYPPVAESRGLVTAPPPIASAPYARRSLWRAILQIGLPAAVAGVLFALDPATHGWLFPRCPVHALSGLCCPGCGVTRALHELLHGHVVAAFFLNPLAVLLLPALLAHKVCAWWIGRRPPVLQQRRLGWFLLTLVVAFGIMRNVPLYPFTLFGQ